MLIIFPVNIYFFAVQGQFSSAINFTKFTAFCGVRFTFGFLRGQQLLDRQALNLSSPRPRHQDCGAIATARLGISLQPTVVQLRTAAEADYHSCVGKEVVQLGIAYGRLCADMSHPWQFYAKVSGLCFTVGAAMELFMIKTGFYEKVTKIEAERLEETLEERREFQHMLREELERQAREKNVKIRFPDEGA